MQLPDRHGLKVFKVTGMSSEPAGLLFHRILMHVYDTSAYFFFLNPKFLRIFLNGI